MSNNCYRHRQSCRQKLLYPSILDFDCPTLHYHTLLRLHLPPRLFLLLLFLLLILLLQHLLHLHYRRRLKSPPSLHNYHHQILNHIRQIILLPIRPTTLQDIIVEYLRFHGNYYSQLSHWYYSTCRFCQLINNFRLVLSLMKLWLMIGRRERSKNGNLLYWWWDFLYGSWLIFRLKLLLGWSFVYLGVELIVFCWIVRLGCWCVIVGEVVFYLLSFG